MPLDSPRTRVNQPPNANATPLQNKDTAFGNPNGDVVDNSQSANLDGSISNPMRQQAAGADTNLFAKAPIFYGIGSN